MKKILALIALTSLLGIGCATKTELSMGHVQDSDDEIEIVQRDYSKYDFGRPGFVTKVVDNRLWVFKEGDKEYDKFMKDGELAKHVTLPAAGPLKVTLKAPDRETIDEYLKAYGDLEEAKLDFSKIKIDKPGFVTRVVDGRVWVFKVGDKHLEQFEKDSELAKHVTLPGAGPEGVTLKAPDKATIDEYLAAK